jgi:hypothetical protein
VATAGGVLLFALLGVRVGAPGSGGELVPTLALAVVVAATSGATAAFALLGAGAATARLSAASARRQAEALQARTRAHQRLEASQRAFFEGEDILAEVEGAEAALSRLGAALDKLAAMLALVEERLGVLDDAARAGDLGRELALTRDEVKTRIDLGRRIHGAARAASFQLACSAPIRRLLRRRPKDLAQGIHTAAAAPAAVARVGAAVAAIEEFLGEVEGARAALAVLELRRLQRLELGDDAADRDTTPEDAWALAMRDLAAIEGAYQAVQERLRVMAVRLDARAGMEVVQSAAGEVSAQARASGIPAAELQGLVDDVARAESAIRMASPPELDARALIDALSRSATAVGGHDGASLDDLLRALNEIA